MSEGHFNDRRLAVLRPLERTSKGEDAVVLLRKFSVSRSPLDLVLLDMNLPRVNGLDVLDFIRSQPFIRDVPVVMFTTSSAWSCLMDPKRLERIKAAHEEWMKPSITWRRIRRLAIATALFAVFLWLNHQYWHLH